MAIYAVVEEHSFSSSDYKYYSKLENAKKELKKLEKEYKKYNNQKVEKPTDYNTRPDDDRFKYGGFWLTGQYSGLICGEYQNAVYIEEIKTED